MSDCLYLGQKHKKPIKDSREAYDCQIYGSCVKTGPSNPIVSCDDCSRKLTLDSENLGKDYLDPLIVTDRKKAPTHVLRGLLAGVPSFLVCGGPSAKQLSLADLDQRGVWSLAINNMAGYCRTNAFLCSDPPSKFHNGIWQDPAMMKFVPTPKLDDCRGGIREKIGDEFREKMIDGERLRTGKCPNTWGFERRSWMKPDESFFLESSAAWGNHNSGVQRTGEEKTVCTMLLGLRMLYYLGSRRIYLVGVDFKMDPTKELCDNYAFTEERKPDAIQSNNSQFAVVNKWMCRMQQNGIFSKFGLEVYNCNERSGLRAFPFVPFELAIEDTLKDFPEEPLDTLKWYEK